jgi:hypothetical protein
MSSTSSVAVLERFKLSDFKFRRERFQLEPGRTLVCPTPMLVDKFNDHLALLLCVD